MGTYQIGLDEELASFLRDADQTVEAIAHELIVLELYRRRTISSGKAAQLLGMTREGFIVYASGLGIPYFTLTPEELAEEIASSETL
jgi:predicted HTH domain antitoxin